MIGALARGPVVGAASRECCLVEDVNCSSVFGLECQVDMGWRACGISGVNEQLVHLKPVGTALLDSTAERFKHGLVETASSGEFPGAQVNVIDQPSHMPSHCFPTRRSGLFGFVSRSSVELTVALLADLGEQVQLGFKKVDMPFFVGQQFIKKLLGNMVVQLRT